MSIIRSLPGVYMTKTKLEVSEMPIGKQVRIAYRKKDRQFEVATSPNGTQFNVVFTGSWGGAYPIALAFHKHAGMALVLNDPSLSTLSAHLAITI